MPTTPTYIHRRQALAKQIGKGSLALFSANQETLRNGDAHYPFRQNSDFYYLTGFNEPNAALVIIGGEKGESILFNRVRHIEAEQWTGPRLGQENAPQVLGVEYAYPIGSLEEKLIELAAGMQAIYYTMGHEPVCEPMILRTIALLKTRQRHGVCSPAELKDIEPIISEMRLFKSDEEIKLMQKAADISVLAHRRAMQKCGDFEYEYQLEAELRYVFTQHGCSGVAYEPIVAAGKNACVLHYTANHGPLSSGELVLIDAAGEYENYAADITRTFPINGKFSAEQRAIYDLVLEAQQAAMRAVKPGVIWSQLQNIIVKILTQGLCDLGLLNGQVDKLIEAGSYKAFYMHGSGHWLGLDVHDSGHYKENNVFRALEPGMVFTIEPGLYIPDNLPQVDARWHHIGVRIEDDVLVTKQGVRNLTSELVVEADEIEAWMR